jgi:hypothetical protein
VFFKRHRATLSKILSAAGTNAFQARHSAKPTFLTDVQLDIINGTMLGDGRVSDLGQYFFKQKIASREYVEYIANALSPFSSPLKEGTAQLGGCIFGYVYFYLPRLDLFTRLRRLWYTDQRTKTVPADFVLNSRTLAFWYCDDGCNYQPKRQIRISSESFCESDIDRLRQMLLDMGILTYSKPTRSGIVIGIRPKSYYDFLDLVREHIPFKCFAYKIDTSKSMTRQPDFDLIRTVWQLRGCNLTQRDIADLTGIHCSTVCRLLKRYTFAGGLLLP